MAKDMLLAVFSAEQDAKARVQAAEQKSAEDLANAENEAAELIASAKQKAYDEAAKLEAKAKDSADEELRLALESSKAKCSELSDKAASNRQRVIKGAADLLLQ